MAPPYTRKPSVKVQESGLQFVQYSQPEPEESIEVDDPFTDSLPIDPQL